MHPVNKILSYFGVQLYRSKRQAGFPWEFRRAYAAELKKLTKTPPPGWTVFSEVMYEVGAHPEDYVDYQCAFASRHIAAANPKRILDVGSYRHFILGLLAHYPVTTVDVRSRKPSVPQESVVTCDAKKLALPNGIFDIVLSLCTIEHLGLGRYGDEIDPAADEKAVHEMARVLAPRGRLVLTTEITRAVPQIAFNAHRIYNRDMIHRLCAKAGLTLQEEAYYSRALGRPCASEEITALPKRNDVYLSVWQKRA